MSVLAYWDAIKPVLSFGSAAASAAAATLLLVLLLKVDIQQAVAGHSLHPRYT